MLWRRSLLRCLANMNYPVDPTNTPNIEATHMQIRLPEDTETQSLAAGYANVEQYVHSLVLRDRERLAIEEGIAAMKEGRVQDFDEFDREFIQNHKIDR